MEKNRNLVGAIFGLILIAAGILTLFGNFFDFINWDTSWPLFIVGIGAVFFVAMVLGGKSSGGLAVPGSILVTIGLILLVLNAADRWEAWAYAWTLIIVAAGAGNLIHGLWSDQPNLRSRGSKEIRDGLVLFLIFGALMQVIFAVSGVESFGSPLFWAALLALLGFILLATRMFRLLKEPGAKVDLFWPVLMIGAGLVLSLAELGILPEGNLEIVLSLWPLLLIVAGIGLIFRDRSAWVGASLGVFVVAALLFVSFAGQGLGLKGLPLNGIVFNIGEGSGPRTGGSGNVITQDRPVSGFDRVELGIPADLKIQQGQAEALTVTGEDNILALLTTNVSGRTLTIRYKLNTNVHPTKPIQITLTVKNLEELQNSSSGNIKMVGPLTTGDFRVSISSSGNISFDEIQADKIRAVISSSGNMTLKGNASSLDLDVSSSGEFRAGDLRLQEARVQVSSSGEATVWVVEDLNATISSSGNISYYGSPQVRSNLTSSGRLLPKGEK